MIATLLVGPRAGIGWFMVALGLTVGLLVLKWSGVDLPDRVPVATRPLVQAMMGALFMAVILAIGVGYEVLRNASMLDAQRRGDELRQKEQARVTAETEARVMNADRMASIGRLAAGIAHEINNPLSYMLTNMELAREAVAAAPPGTLPSDLLASIDEAVLGAKNIRSIVRDLKTFSRAEEEKLTAVDLEVVLDSSLRMIANEAKHRAKIVRERGGIDPARANASRLAQVFLNLLLNAMEAIPLGAPDKNQIQVRTKQLPGSGRGEIAVEITDTGIGIKAENRARVMEPFFTTKPPGEGTGLGLSVCKNIVDHLGGRLEIESTEGRGTTARVVLPVFAGAATLDLPATDIVQPPVKRTPRRARILVIDDDPNVAKALARLLKNHDVTVLHDSVRALAQLEQARDFDLVFCDLMMPDRTGMDIYESVRRFDPEFADRMVFISGGVFTGAARSFLDSVKNRFVEKPFERGEIMAIVDGIAAK
jgi:signal transduction histidine kinase